MINCAHESPKVRNYVPVLQAKSSYLPTQTPSRFRLFEDH